MVVTRGHGANLRGDWAKRFDDVSGRLNQGRAVADQLIAALGTRVERRTGYGHYFPARLCGDPGRDQRSRPRRRLDYDGARTEAGDDPIAPREIARAGLEPGRSL